MALKVFPELIICSFALAFIIAACSNTSRQYTITGRWQHQKFESGFVHGVIQIPDAHLKSKYLKTHFNLVLLPDSNYKIINDADFYSQKGRYICTNQSLKLLDSDNQVWFNGFIDSLTHTTLHLRLKQIQLGEKKKDSVRLFTAENVVFYFDKQQ